MFANFQAFGSIHNILASQGNLVTQAVFGIQNNVLQPVKNKLQNLGLDSLPNRLPLKNSNEKSSLAKTTPFKPRWSLENKLLPSPENLKEALQVSESLAPNPDLLRILRKEILNLGDKENIIFGRDSQKSSSLAHLDKEALRNLCSKRKINRFWPSLSTLSGRPILYKKVTIHARGFKSKAERRLGELESEANQDPTNASKQAAFYKELYNAGYHSIVISRFENYDLGADFECLETYVLSLIQLSQNEKVVGRVLTSIQNKEAFRGLKVPHGASNQDLLRIITEKYPTQKDNIFSGAMGSHGQPIRVIVEEATRVSMWKTVRSVGSGIAYVFLALTFISLVLENTGVSKNTVKPMPEFEPDSQAPISFEDVQGVDEAKMEMVELVEFLKDPSRFNAMGGKLPKGVLLTGPPGTGKTLLAKATAGEAGVPFFFMSGSEFDEMYVGVGARRVRDLFAAARKKAPSIVFIDELDSVGAKRNPRDPTFMKQTLNQLLCELDGFSPSEGVIFIGATNFPELLDKALLRPGRFDRTIDVPLPDVRGRVQVLRLHSKKITLDPTVNLEVLARGTPGFSGAELANLVNLAAIEASRNRSPNVTAVHLESAKDRVIMGAEKKSMYITESDRLSTAYHESGHAITAFYTPCAQPLYKATVIPRGASLGMTMQLPEMDKTSYSKCELRAMMDVCMGGRVAEELFLGEDHVTTGASNDFAKATQISRSMVTELGMCQKMGVVDYTSNQDKLSSETKKEIDSQVKKLHDESYARVMALLKSKRTELDRLATALARQETMNLPEMEAAMKGRSK
ncbi:i-AAA protease yme1 [Entomophthora muscae]|uniref:I-AAA protease yme1 n=1 Tax=Entomophthora muscae TaxID=34485 RepID=A0ACC2U076_9FUNG|nr:i-AAA protease yme1 [Entomophthora muscae]